MIRDTAVVVSVIRALQRCSVHDFYQRISLGMIVTFEGFWSEVSTPEGIPFELWLTQNFESQRGAGLALKLTSPHCHSILYLSQSFKSQSIVLKFLYIVSTVLQTAGFYFSQN